MLEDRTHLWTVTCPNGHAVRITAGDVRRLPTKRCPHCQAVIRLQNGPQTIREAERQIEKLRQSLGFGKR